LAETTQRLNDTYNEVESIKDELNRLNDVIDTVENLKKIVNGIIIFYSPQNYFS
jgi:hypothetical protein